jgi:hypothetical protein
VEYKGTRLDCGYRVDVLVENRLIIELKAVEHVLGIHQAQLLTYMKLAGIQTGLLINFNVCGVEGRPPAFCAVAVLRDLRVLRGFESASVSNRNPQAQEV